ncbi:metallophosphoesterase family protein [Rhizobium leguminosarum]|uniref:metallophosphoesterase family protein n=1 Tax=Rhizobium leguminosarum TaxID=384 RepID=UPI001C9481E4|nr:metallophosphoesterase [Rhizobium leguminosarum]MBY5625931.1 metallophosphoesterase [Rhizobium leguminosarum]
MIRIAHLSDIHFGNSFSEATWVAVADAVVRFDPDLIVVSGDLVDDPSPAHLLAAKCALSDLSQCARERSNERNNGTGRAAQVIVVPGNHDVFESGVAVGMKRLDWFERVFHADDTDRAEMLLKDDLGITKLGFNSRCLGFKTNIRPQDAGLITQSWNRLLALMSGRRLANHRHGNGFAGYLGAVEPRKTVNTPQGTPLLLALLDSNPAHDGLFTATGVVDNDQLIQLGSELAAAENVYVARIAVVHHHVLPIAFAAGAARTTGEPMMVLRNAGAVLRTLADHKFDLILHGHWHRSQFTRIDFGSDGQDSYPIAVASAGSAAMVSEDNPSANSFNLITIAETGQIEVKSVYYGASQSPNPDGELGRHYRVYKEPLSATKRRTYVRAVERHDIECDEREQACEITENGDLWVTHRIEGLRISGEISVYPKRPLGVFIPPHGHFIRETLKPDDASAKAGITLTEAHDHPGSKSGQLEYYWINLPGNGLARDGKAARYAIQHGCANCMKMTQWEALERAQNTVGGAPPADFDSEWLGARISFPTRKLILRAKLPQSLAAVQPHVECRRQADYPLYEIDAWRDAKMSPMDMVVDPGVQDEEGQGLRYEAPTGTWILEINRPLVGYQYSIRWKIPGDIQNARISGNTREWQRRLLNLGNRADEAATGERDREAIRQFELLCSTLEVEICHGGSDEKWVVALFVYDSEKLALRPILSKRSWADDGLPRSFEVPHGDGVSGAAFQQRRIITWSRQKILDNPTDTARSLIFPVPLPGSEDRSAEIVNMLALPVYHTGTEDLRQPPPWAAIGVVTVASSSYASPINGMDDAQRRRLRSAAQTQVDSIVHALSAK